MEANLDNLLKSIKDNAAFFEDDDFVKRVLVESIRTNYDYCNRQNVVNLLLSEMDRHRATCLKVSTVLRDAGWEGVNSVIDSLTHDAH